jgi:CRP-like cAMP-binding protein
MAKNTPSRTADVPITNLLLAALPTDVSKRLAPALVLVAPKLKDILHKPGEPIEHVYFPGRGGFFSVLATLEDGGMVEVAVIGSEGLVGTAAIFNGGPSTGATMIQAEMEACYRMPVAVFHRELNRHGPFYDAVTRYAQALVGMIMQSTACNAVHSLEQRLARWLLLAHDRVGRTEFPLTQEFAAMMLGAARPTVTLVAGSLQKAGLISYRRGHLTIVNREGLEQASCECYRVATKLLKASRV